ncbi:TGS domain-containing protein [Paenibacillus sp. MSJ-34]|nr:TGS domain-containing protein [Paenibacillus sp. MSJ-34]MBU5444444.1 TGS domain-containing protein [Paenibacillus sp. MSJ-34]
MSTVQVTLPDGSVREYPVGTTVEQIAESISPGLKKNAVAGKIDGKPADLSRPVEQESYIEIVTLDSKDGLEVYRHSTAHLMAQATP